MEDPNDLVTVYRAPSLGQAHLLKNLLAVEGIEAAVSEENEPFAGLPVATPDVLVRRKDLSRATAIVDEYNAHRAAEQTESDWTCPKCGNLVEAGLDECYECGTARPV